VLAYARPYARGWAVILLLSLGGSALALAQPWPLQVIVDHVLARRPMSSGLAWFTQHLAGANNPYGLLGWSAAACLLTLALTVAVEAALSRGWIKVGQAMVLRLSNHLFANLQRRSLVYHSRASVGDSMGRISGDSWCAYELVEGLILTPLRATITIAVMLWLMAAMDLSLTLWSLAIAPGIAAGVLLSSRRVRASAADRRNLEIRMQSHVQQTLGGLPVVQAFGREQQEHVQFVALAKEAIRAQRRNIIAVNLAGLGAGAAIALGSGLVLWLGARRVLAGTLSVGGLLVFLAYLTSLQFQMQALAKSYLTLQGIRAKIDRVVEVLSSDPEVSERPGARAIAGRARGELRFEGVWFGYEPNVPAVKDVTFDVNPGEVVALVGPSGAGKSTLAALACRLLDPWRGRVTLDGHDLRDLRLDDVRGNVALVLQDPFLFPASVRQNIAYGRPGASLAEVEAAARAADAHGFIQGLAGGYDAVVGERGTTLSGGQRQRLSLARAFLKDSPVLVLDEPTSALDVASEAAVVGAVRRLTAGRSCLVIAHRLSTARAADRVVVLDGGRVVEQGTHERLLETGGLYARLWGVSKQQVNSPAVVLNEDAYDRART
jgi:ATP-binding cassette subfamily B protein/subfamily B ATP-binding cassette protein MsbA